MSNGKPPGPTGSHTRAERPDSGTLARTLTATPDAVGTGARSVPSAAVSAPPANVKPATVTATTLDGYLGKHISEVCENGFDQDDDNHCAHFVSHVLGLEFGVTCRTMGTVGSTGSKANIRVQEIFPRCPAVGEWASRPATSTTCLVFITKAANVDLKAKVMSNVPRKHVGIFVTDKIWHYSNSKRKVVKQTPEEFSKHYAAPYNAMFYGSFP